jgi:hypothetical protein
MRPSPDWLDHWRVQFVVSIDVEQPVDRHDDAQQHEVTHDEKRDHEDRDIAQGEIFEHFVRNLGRKPGLINRHPSALFPRRLIACIMPIRANTIEQLDPDRD